MTLRTPTDRAATGRALAELAKQRFGTAWLRSWAEATKGGASQRALGLLRDPDRDSAVSTWAAAVEALGGELLPRWSSDCPADIPERIWRQVVEVAADLGEDPRELLETALAVGLPMVRRRLAAQSSP